MNFDLPSELKIVQRSAREFAEQVIAPLVNGMEETGEFPEQLVRQMGEAGLLGLITPQKYGGSDLGYLARTVAIQEISRISAAIGISLQCHHMQVASLVHFGTDKQKKKYLPALASGEYLGVVAVTEPTGGSDLMGMTSTAQPDAGGYVVNGRKCFITNSHFAGAPLVAVKTGDGPRGISTFVIERKCRGYSTGRQEHKLGLRGSNTGELFFTNCHVSRENMIGDEGAGMKVALKTISETGRPGIAAIALGILDACLEEAVKFAKERVLYSKPISKLQAIQWNIADIYAEREAAKWLCYKASWLKDQGRDCATEMTLAKVATTGAAVRASRKALEVHGGYGTMMDYPVQRLFRDAMVCVSAGGTTEIGKIVISRAALD